MGRGFAFTMNPIQRAVLAAAAGHKPAPILIQSGKKSRAWLEWQQRQIDAESRRERKTTKRRANRLKRKLLKTPRTLEALIQRCKPLKSEHPAEALHRSIIESRRNRKDWYRDIYLRSEHWKLTRKVALAACGGICAECKRPYDTLDVHHLTYRHIFDVMPQDLVAICRACHDRKHPARSPKCV